MKFVFDHLNKLEFQQAKEKIYNILDQYSSPPILNYITENESVHKKSKELYDYIYRDTPQYRTDTNPHSLKSVGEQLGWVTEEIKRRYTESDSFLAGIASLEFLK